MPFLWIGISSLAGIITGALYEKESAKKVVEVAQQSIDSAPKFNWFDKLVMAGAGVAAYYIYKKVK